MMSTLTYKQLHIKSIEAAETMLMVMSVLCTAGLSFKLWQLNLMAACAVVSHVSLAAELDLLLHLLALPSAVVCAASVPSGTQPMFASGAVAALYAGTVLCSSGEFFSLLHTFCKYNPYDDIYWVYRPVIISFQKQHMHS